MTEEKPPEPPNEQPVEEIRPEGTSISTPPSSPGWPPLHRDGQDAPVSFELVIRMQPHGPTTAIRVTRAASLADVKREALRRLGRGDANPSVYFLTLEGRFPIDESRTVGEEGLFDLAFLQLGRAADVGLTGATKAPNP